MPGFHDLVVEVWALEVRGSPVARFTAKLKRTKLLLRDFNKNHGNVSTNVQILRDKLQDVQNDLKNSIDISLLDIE